MGCRLCVVWCAQHNMASHVKSVNWSAVCMVVLPSSFLQTKDMHVRLIATLNCLFGGWLSPSDLLINCQTSPECCPALTSSLLGSAPACLAPVCIPELQTQWRYKIGWKQENVICPPVNLWIFSSRKQELDTDAISKCRTWFGDVREDV